MIRKVKFIHSLNIRILLILLLSLVIAVLVYFGVSAIGDYLVETYYMSPEAVSARRIEIYNELKAYVLENQLSSKDSAKIGEWTMGKQFASITIRGEHMRVDAGSWGASMTELPPMEEETPTLASGEGVYYMRFSDGIFQVIISESSQSRQYFLSTVTAIVLACASIILIMLIYVHQITVRVTQLAKCAQEIGRGNLKREIYVSGEDELSLLGREMNDMRQAIVERIESEHKAWQANSSLITAISHDLRTPMTAMIGYLELLKNGAYTDEAQRVKFTENAHTKAMELKDLTDELFKYFLVFGSSDIPLELKTYDARILFDQILGESSIELADAGFNIRNIRCQSQCSIYVDALHLKRVFDNLFSNVKKYADKAKPVVILSEIVGGDRLSVCISNSIDKKQSKAESTKIGLQTCSKIVSQLGGVFKTSGDDDHFVAEVILPIVLESID